MISDVVVVTGGAGFIGSHLVSSLLAEATTRVVNLDKLTYAADGDFHSSLARRETRYELIEMDIADSSAVAKVIISERPDLVLNLAAESHVDRSIDSSLPFVRTNYQGTHSLLEACLAYWKGADKHTQERFRFVQVSTDEVFGDIEEPAMAGPGSPMNPSSPYAATKAGADLLARSFLKTYGLPVIVTHSSNNYGPRQHPEKLIPVAIANALSDLPIPLYGDGLQVRDWIHVEDNVRGILAATQRGEVGTAYCIAGGNQYTNREVVERLCQSLDAIHPRADGSSYSAQVEYVSDRPGHDMRYSIDDSATRGQLRWSPVIEFASGLRATVEWFVTNRWWWESTGGYSYERLGHVD
jgi:dTDP-glucose 4,6-dehydratase